MSIKYQCDRCGSEINISTGRFVSITFMYLALFGEPYGKEDSKRHLCGVCVDSLKVFFEPIPPDPAP